VTTGPKRLTGDALAATLHRGSHMQIIAAAGAGKTETVSQRVAKLLQESVPPTAIVAFTFTERAAAELKNRIAQRVREMIGDDAMDKLSNLFVGTIHSYCFRLLQTAVPKYETYDVLDPNQQTAFLVREANRLEIKRLDAKGKMFSSVERFLSGLDVVENELLDPDTIEGDFGDVLRRYLEALEKYRLLTFGQQVVRAVKELERPEVAKLIHNQLKYLIVDEYQDVNEVQEPLIAGLVAGGAELCVVGDDDQAIYQFRGSSVRNIVEFATRYPGVRTFRLEKNRRSRPTIIDTANTFSASIPGRLPKKMKHDRAPLTVPEVVVWERDTEQQEAGSITQMIDDLHTNGFAYRDIAVLVRGRVSYQQLLDQFRTFGIPVQPGGRTGLFDQPEAEVLGRTYAWLVDVDWGRKFKGRESQTIAELLARYRVVFGLSAPQMKQLRDFLEEWKARVPQEKRPVDLVHEFYELLEVLGVRHWPLDDTNANRLGTLARFSNLLTDYESVRRRARPDDAVAGEQVGGADRGKWYYWHLGAHIVNFANEAYGDFDGEPDVGLDAVDLLTVHGSKGLEWPAVFVPSMTKGRFPSRRNGTRKDWPLSRGLFDADRYEGTDADERRLFYVAMTRARDWLSVSRHVHVGDGGKQHQHPSPYLSTLAAHVVDPDDVKVPDGEAEPSAPDDQLTITFSELSQFLECGMAYRLRTMLGFQPRLAPELGYGKAVHHMLRRLADYAKDKGKVPTANQIERMLDEHFFLPIANKPAHRQMKDAAHRLMTTYASDHADDLFRVWESERPFELRLDDITVTGRADVILDNEGGVKSSLAILDYKTSVRPDADHNLQLQIYTDAGLREGLDVRGAYVHDLSAALPDRRKAVDVAPAALSAAETMAVEAGLEIRARAFEPRPGGRCGQCEVRNVCKERVK
jgi:DNA helicase-2/ATP-dependent DNA helicase PcrA